MKTRKLIFLLFAIVIISLAGMNSCQKKSENTKPAATCSDGIKNQGETDVDCAGTR